MAVADTSVSSKNGVDPAASPRIEWIPAGRLRPNPRNARTNAKKQIGQIAASMSPHSIFARTGKRPHSRRLGCPAPVSGQKFLAFRYFGRGFRAPVSARYFPISVSGEGRLVRLLAETSSMRDRVKLLRPVNQEHRN